jgi:hypothetical protein
VATLKTWLSLHKLILSKPKVILSMPGLVILDEQELQTTSSTFNWFIWMARNNKIFDNKPPSISTVAYKTLGLYQNWKEIHLVFLVK